MSLKDENIGFWYLPNSKSALNGTLIKGDNNSYYLQLAQTLDNLKTGIEEYSAITGILSSGEKISLFNVSMISNQWSFPGFPLVKYSCNFICIGAIYNSISEINILECHIGYPYLNYWLNNKPFEVTGRQETYEITAHYRMPEVKQFKFESFSLEFSYKVNASGDGYSEYKIIQTEFAKMRFDNEISLNAMLDEVDILTNFLTLCYGEMAHANFIKFIDSNSNQVELILRANEYKMKNLNEHDMFLKFTYFGEQFKNSYATWRHKVELLKPIIIYFVEAHNREFHVPMSFLKIVQALEAFSRRMRKNAVLSEEGFEDLQRRLTQGIESEDDKNFILNILSNEPRLRQRLTEIFSETNEVFGITSSKRKSFINKIVNTRNYYTHFDTSLEDNILDTTQMYHISQYMKLILRVLLLKELNIQNQLINERTKQSKEFLNFKEGLGLIKPVKLFEINS